jgi:RNA polymerase sigma factor for flagellar operon FliA
MALEPADSKDVIARVGEHLELVEIIARQIRRQLGSPVNLDDMCSAGREGLLLAARSYDAARGVPFRRWANLRIRGAIIDAMRQMGTVPRRVYQQLRAIEAGDRFQDAMLEEDSAAPASTPADADQRLGNYLAGIATAMAIGFLSPTTGPDPDDVQDQSASAEEQIAREELHAALRQAIEARPEAERHLLMRHYFDGVSFDDAAKEIGLSKSWASRLHGRAIEGLARDLKKLRVG